MYHHEVFSKNVNRLLKIKQIEHNNRFYNPHLQTPPSQATWTVEFEDSLRKGVLPGGYAGTLR